MVTNTINYRSENNQANMSNTVIGKSLCQSYSFILIENQLISLKLIFNILDFVEIGIHKSNIIHRSSDKPIHLIIKTIDLKYVYKVIYV